VERARKAAKAPVLALGRAVDAFAGQLEDRLRRGEDHYKAQIEAEEARRAAVKAEAERKERERVEALRAGVAKLRSYVERAAGQPAETILKAITALSALSFTETDWQEFVCDAMSARDETVYKLRNLYDKAVEHEAQAAEAERLRVLAEQQAAMRDSVEAIRELYRVVSTPCRHPSDQIQALLAMGCRRFGLAIGILAHIEGERYEIIQVLSPGGEIAQGDIFNLDDTYCRETLRTQGPLGIEHTATSHWHSHPCYRKFRLEAYFGVPVRVGTTSYGTLNFSDFRPRPTPFTTVDRELIQLMAEWVGGALEQERMATAAQRQQALLAHASRLNTLGEMASGLVHEINQPVTAITLYTEACLARLRRGDIDPEETRDLVEKIASQSTRANAIIQHIRRFARQGKPQYTVNPVGEMLTEISDFLELETRRHGVRIGYDIAPDLPAALADRLQVQLVVCNLVRNAVDATAASTSLRLVTILARAAEAQIEIAVCDSGPGLKPEEMEQLMHPFFTTKPEGLGLGLPISQSIVEAHGGRLWATVNLDSPGMTFHFTLPVAGSAEPRTQRPVHALESNRAGRV
jgi:signal transduction histidine kinase